MKKIEVRGFDALRQPLRFRKGLSKKSHPARHGVPSSGTQENFVSQEVIAKTKPTSSLSEAGFQP